MAEETNGFDDLLSANRSFAETFELGGFDSVAHGDAKIFRNPGGRVTPQALELSLIHI